MEKHQILQRRLPQTPQTQSHRLSAIIQSMAR
jgi:hypothetical protein